MKDWRFFTWESDWTEARIKYTDGREETFSFCDLPLYHCPDLLIEPEDNAARIRVYEEVIVKIQIYLSFFYHLLIKNYLSRPKVANMRMVIT